MGGIYIKSVGKSGKATLTLSADHAQTIQIPFTVTVKEA